MFKSRNLNIQYEEKCKKYLYLNLKHLNQSYCLLQSTESPSKLDLNSELKGFWFCMPIIFLDQVSVLAKEPILFVPLVFMCRKNSAEIFFAFTQHIFKEKCPLRGLCTIHFYSHKNKPEFRFEFFEDKFALQMFN